MTMSIDLDEVRHALTVRAVLDAYAHPIRRSGQREVDSTACPRRKDHSRRAFTANLQTGAWRCFPCGIAGDPIRLVAEFEQLSDRDDFPAVLLRAAEIAGVGASTLSDQERHVRALRWRNERERRETQEKFRRVEREYAAIPKATDYWASLQPRHPRGENYLRERGVIDALERDLVRFDLRHDGSPAIVLHTRDGRIRNVVRRRFPALGEPKTPGLPACPTAGTLVGSLVAPLSDVIITEGVIDTLTAHLAWPEATVLGAHGANNLATIVRAVAPLLVRNSGRMLLVPHNDTAGKAACSVAGRAAVEAGLSTSTGSLLLVHHREKDLNDAWRKGWKP